MSGDISSMELISISTGCPEFKTSWLLASSSGARPPLNVNVPTKFCGETLVSVVPRNRAPNFHVCAPRLNDQEFVSS